MKGENSGLWGGRVSWLWSVNYWSSDLGQDLKPLCTLEMLCRQSKGSYGWHGRPLQTSKTPSNRKQKHLVPDEPVPPESLLYYPVRSTVVNSGGVMRRERDGQHRWTWRWSRNSNICLEWGLPSQDHHAHGLPFFALVREWKECLHLRPVVVALNLN